MFRVSTFATFVFASIFLAVVLTASSNLSAAYSYLDGLHRASGTGSTTAIAQEEAYLDMADQILAFPLSAGEQIVDVVIVWEGPATNQLYIIDYYLVIEVDNNESSGGGNGVGG